MPDDYDFLAAATPRLRAGDSAMTHADVQALIAKWRARARDWAKSCEIADREGREVAAEAYAEGSTAWTISADELAPVVQALEALRDEMCEWLDNGDAVYSPFHRITDWRDTLDVLLHGAEGQEKENTE